MAGFARTSFLSYGSRVAGIADMDHYLYNNHTANASLCPLLDESDLHDEFHHFVACPFPI